MKHVVDPNIADKGRNDHQRVEPTAHCSRNEQLPPAPIPTPKQRADQYLKEAERAKERILQVPGNTTNYSDKHMVKHDEPGDLVHSVIVDEEYSAIASHVDDSLKHHIMQGEYVDFVRLIPRDRIQSEEDQRMEMVNRGGLSYWVPVSERNTATISNIACWEEAFRIYSRIYTEGNPTQAIELIQYNHIIHEAALEYPWENVYVYDREFRIHMSKYPSCNWGIILQQAWTLKMKRTATYGANRRDGLQNPSGGGTSTYCKNICWKFNQGKCNFGMSCKFERHCGICNKWGHGAHMCRKGREDGRQQCDNHHYDPELGERYKRPKEHHEPRNDRYHYYKKDQR